MIKPNLFNYATSELSQDAIICYMLEWANSKFKKIDEETHNIGVKLLDAFFNKYSEVIEKPQTYDNVEVIKQDNNIDVLCIVNNKYPIIIEDKTNTKNHGDQLERYFQQIESREEFESKNIMCIYFKTHDQSCYKVVEENKYKVFLRKEILVVLNSAPTNNIILNDYKLFLQKIEDDVKSYKVLPVHEWHWDSWKGFYLELKKQLGDGYWDYVPNAQGGFLGFWWSFNSKTYDHDNKKYTYRVYLQMETNFIGKEPDCKLVIKLGIDEKANISNIVSSWKDYIISYDKDTFTKPKVVRSGKTSSVGIVSESFIVLNENKCLNIVETINNLKKIENQFIELIENYK